MIRTGIIGSAGRREDAEKMDKTIFFSACDKVSYMLSFHDFEDRCLVSGGAAWMDHVAVRLFLDKIAARLELHFPCDWDAGRVQFEDTGINDWKENPGGTLNFYHRKFALRMGMDPHGTLWEIQEALGKGARYEKHYGFHNRNTNVAEVDRLIAFTWGEGEIPKPGGTFDTWRKSRAFNKTHIPLATLRRE